MTSQRWPYLATFALALAVAAVLRVAMGARFLDLYGWAIAALVAALLLGLEIAGGLSRRGWTRWPRWALTGLIVVPALVVAAARIAFWLAFYASSSTAITLGMVSTVATNAAGGWLALAAGVWLLLAAAVMAYAARRRN